MEYKILINKDSHPVLVEVPEKPLGVPVNDHSIMNHRFEQYEAALTAAIADESKHIRFSFGDRITIDQYYDYRLKRGDLVDVPDGFNVELLNQYFECGEWVKIHPNKFRTVAILSVEPAASQHAPSEGVIQTPFCVIKASEVQQGGEGQKVAMLSNWQVKELMEQQNKEMLDDFQKTVYQARNKAILDCIRIARHARREQSGITDYFGMVLKELIDEMKKLKVDPLSNK